jgi:hypothetical protein
MAEGMLQAGGAAANPFRSAPPSWAPQAAAGRRQRHRGANGQGHSGGGGHTRGGTKLRDHTPAPRRVRWGPGDHQEGEAIIRLVLEASAGLLKKISR